MIKTEKKIVTSQREEESVVEAYCDFCEKPLKLTNEDYSNCQKDSKVVGKCVNLTTSHRDWGNDSVDSIKDYQFCSIKCCLDWIIAHKKRT